MRTIANAIGASSIGWNKVEEMCEMFGWDKSEFPELAKKTAQGPVELNGIDYLVSLMHSEALSASELETIVCSTLDDPELNREFAELFPNCGLQNRNGAMLEILNRCEEFAYVLAPIVVRLQRKLDQQPLFALDTPDESAELRKSVDKLYSKRTVREFALPFERHLGADKDSWVQLIQACGLANRDIIDLLDETQRSDRLLYQLSIPFLLEKITTPAQRRALSERIAELCAEKDMACPLMLWHRLADTLNPRPPTKKITQNDFIDAKEKPWSRIAKNLDLTKAQTNKLEQQHLLPDPNLFAMKQLSYLTSVLKPEFTAGKVYLLVQEVQNKDC